MMKSKQAAAGMSLLLTPGSVTHATGLTTANGSIGVSTVSGGSTPYTFLWSSGPGASTIATPTTSAAKPALLPGQYTLRIIDGNSSEIVYVYDVSYTSGLSLITQASDPAVNDAFGYSCAIDGQYMVAGAYNKATGTGAAYTFLRSSTASSGTYGFLAKLLSPAPASGQFGYSVDMSGDTVVIGEPLAATGRVHVFFRTNDTTWSVQTGTTADDATTGDKFGNAVAVDGDYIMVGAPEWGLKPVVQGIKTGASYVFIRAGTTWTQQALLVAPDPSLGDSFGVSVSISGTYCAIGATGWDRKAPSALAGCGCVYIFSRSAITWTHSQQVLASDAAVNAAVGSSISISGDYIAVGARSRLGGGAVYVFTRSTDTSNWSQQAQLTGGDSGSTDLFGNAVSLRGSNLLVGAPQALHAAVSNAGKAYLFVRVDTAWFKQVVVVESTPETGDKCGFAVAVSDRYIVAGAHSWAQKTPTSLSAAGAVFTRTLPYSIVPGSVTVNGNFGATTANGSIGAATIVGGQAPYSYAWTSTGTNVSANTTPGLSSLAVGTYTLTVTDAAAVAVSCTYTVSNYPAIVIGPAVITHAAAAGSATGSIASAVVSGGTGSYSYRWTSSSGATYTDHVSVVGGLGTLLPGRYTLTVTDSNAATAVYVYEVGHVTDMTRIVQASDPAVSDNFGYSCAIDGQYMVVGSFNKTGGGAVYTYLRSNTTTTGQYAFLAKILSPAAGNGFKFGQCVGLSGNTAIVGEPAATGGGKVHVFLRTTDTTWTAQTGTGLVAADRSASDLFGFSCAIDGEYMVVGANAWSTKSAPIYTSCGAAYVYKRTGSTWAQESGGKLLAADPSSSDLFGYSVSISGSYIAVGAYQWDQKTPSSIADCGAVYVYSRSGTVWTQDAVLLAADRSATDSFGYSVSISGNYVVAGARGWDRKVPAISGCGAAYIFVRNASTSLWSQQSQLTAGDDASDAVFGDQVSISGLNVAVGASNANHGNVSAGRVYTFVRSGTDWIRGEVLGGTGPVASDRLGGSVAISNQYIVAGAWEWDRKTPSALSASGAVFTKSIDYRLAPGAVTNTTGKFGDSTTADGVIGAAEIVGGTAPYTFAWTSTATDVSSSTTAGPLLNLRPGTYTLSVTDATSAVLSYSYTVKTVPQIEFRYGRVTHASSPSSATGAIAAVTVVGGSGTLIYSWSSGATAISTPTTLAAKSALLPGRYTLTATDSNGDMASFVYEVSFLSSMTSSILSVDPASTDLFGASCAIDGEYMVVGAYNKTQTSFTSAGAAYIFVRDSTANGYVYGAKLVSPTPASGLRFGRNVGISGDTVVIGEYGANKAYVFVRASDDNWPLQTPSTGLTYTDPRSTDEFGADVDIDGDYIVIGASSWNKKSEPFANRCGAAFVFKRTGSAWSEEAILLAGDPSTNDSFGSSVSISGSLVAVGAPSRSFKNPSILNVGAVYVFMRSETSWSAQNSGLPLLPSNPSSAMQFASRMSLSGDSLAVGVPVFSEQAPSIVQTGAVYMFQNGGTSQWSEQAILRAGDTSANALFGTSVCIHGNQLIVGASGALSTTGQAYLFSRDGNIWKKHRVLTAPTASGRFGSSAAISNKYAVTGAEFSSITLTNQGAAYSTSLLFVSPGGVTRPGNYNSSDGAIAAASVQFPGTAPYTYSWTSSRGATAVTGVTAAELSNISRGTYTLSVTDANGSSGICVYTVTSTYSEIVIPTRPIIHATGPTSANGNIGNAGAVTGGTGIGYIYSWTSSIGATAIGNPTQLGAQTFSLLPGLYTLTTTDSNGGSSSHVYDVSYTRAISQALIAQASDPAANDNFGYSCAIDGQYMVASAYRKTVSAIGSAGAAYTFKRTNTLSTGTYTFLSKLVSPVPGSAYLFGQSIAISGDTVVVGEPDTAGGGRVYPFFRTTDTTWTLQASTGFAGSDTTSQDQFGFSVGIDGDYIAVGTPSWDTKPVNFNISGCGAVYVFKRTGANWAQEARLLASDPSASDALGYSVSISGTLVAAGARSWSQKTPTALANSGAVYVYSRSGTTWTQENGRLPVVPSDPSVTARFGTSVSISGSYMVVGAPTWSQKLPFITTAGAAYMFVRDGTGLWSQQAQLTAGDLFPSMNFGSAVSIRGNNVTVGAHTASAIAGTAGVGRCYLFYRKGTSWVKTDVLLDTSATVDDNYGFSVSTTDKYTTGGAYRWDRKSPSALTNSGAVLTTALVAQALAVYGGITTPSAFGQSTGIIGAIEASGGTSPYTYTWTGGLSDGPAAKTGLSPSSYTVTVTDAASTVITATYTVAENPALSLTGGTVTNVAIFGQSTGAISAVTTVGGVAPYTFSWSGGLAANGNAKTGLSAGTYTLTLTDSALTVITRVYTVTQNTVLALTGGTITSVAIFGQSTGAISAVTLTGGVQPYTYLWSGGLSANGNAKTGLPASTYTLAATDSVGAVVNRSFVITQNPQLSISGGAITAVAVFGQSTGAIAAVVVTGGVQPYSYAWTGGLAPSASAKLNISGGTYVLTVTDAVGAVLTASYTVQAPLGAIAAATVASPINGGGTVTITALNGTGSYTYSWKRNGAGYSGTGPFLSGLSPGTYTCAIVSGASTHSISIYVGSEIRVLASPTSISAFWTEVSSTASYRVEYYTPGAGTQVHVLTSSTPATSVIIPNLTPGTIYTIDMYTIDGVNSGLSTVTTTLPTVTLLSFMKSSFKDQGAPVIRYDISELKTSAAIVAAGLNKDKIVNSIFATGDTVRFASSAAAGNTSVRQKSAAVVRLTETIAVKKNSAVYAPFDKDGTATGQTVNLLLLDGVTTVPVEYNAASETITISGGVARKVGDKFLFDGQIVKIGEDVNV